MQAMTERQKKIADGIAAGERGHHELQLAQKKIVEQLRDAKEQANEIVEKAHKRAAQIIEEAKIQAKDEGKRIITLAKSEIDHQLLQARQSLQQEVVDIAIKGAEKIIGSEIKIHDQKRLLNDLMSSL